MVTVIAAPVTHVPEAGRDGRLYRRRVTHGWAFWDHSKEEIIGIRNFLETGAIDELPEQYRAYARRYGR